VAVTIIRKKSEGLEDLAVGGDHCDFAKQGRGSNAGDLEVGEELIVDSLRLGGHAERFLSSSTRLLPCWTASRCTVSPSPTVTSPWNLRRVRQGKAVVHTGPERAMY
jgi:hypothetical protein